MNAVQFAPPDAAQLSLEDNLLVARKPLVDDARFDVTPMVDLVFMMNIFFLVTWIAAALAEVDLPAARHCVAVDPDTATIVTVTINESGATAVYLGDVQRGAEIEAAQIEARVNEAAHNGLQQGKSTVLIKAAREVRLRDVARIANVATAIKGIKLNLAVMEKE
jgi:biopolymer transport protein ExbD